MNYYFFNEEKQIELFKKIKKETEEKWRKEVQLIERQDTQPNVHHYITPRFYQKAEYRKMGKTRFKKNK